MSRIWTDGFENAPNVIYPTTLYNGLSINLGANFSNTAHTIQVGRKNGYCLRVGRGSGNTTYHSSKIIPNNNEIYLRFWGMPTGQADNNTNVGDELSFFTFD